MWHVMGVVERIMGVHADVVMCMAMAVDRFDDGPNGMRMGVGSHHRTSQQRRKN
jgi:hypothetical protein